MAAFAGGSPLALSLAAAAGSGWTPSAEVIGALLGRLVGEIPSAAHHRALEVAAQAFATTEDLLRSALPEDDAHALFAWLRALPFVESGPQGVYPHDAAREALAADLRWRAPEAHRAVRRRLTEEYLRRLRSKTPWARSSTCSATCRPWRPCYSWSHRWYVRGDALTTEDAPVIVDMAERAEGRSRPRWSATGSTGSRAAFTVYRLIETGRAVAFQRPAAPDPRSRGGRDRPGGGRRLAALPGHRPR